MLDNNMVVTTVMSNSGLFKALREAGIDHEETAVGDRFVYECMEKGGYSLGGEQSGHIILKKYATTGDGLLTAIMVAEEMRDRKSPLSKLSEAVVPYPQVTKNVRVSDKSATVSDEEVKKKYDELNGEIGDRGRILLRVSGTEPVIRIMAECENRDDCDKYISRLYDVIKKRGYCCE